MKVVIVGPGAMGCLFAGLLRKAGHDVWILDKSKDRAEIIERNGIQLEGIGGKRVIRLKATINPNDIGAADLVFIWVKAYDTRSAINSVYPVISPETLVISLQNGLGNLEAIADSVGIERVIGGITSHGATRLEIGKVRHAGKGDTVIGRMDKKGDGDMCKLARLLSKADIETHISDDIFNAIWSKLIINAAINPLTAITSLKNGRLLDFDETRRLLDLVTAEAEKIAQMAGISLAYPDIKGKVYAVCEATAQNTSSMLQDVLRGRRTEIDAINGAIVQKARELKTDAPVNEVLMCLVKMLELS